MWYTVNIKMREETPMKKEKRLVTFLAVIMLCILSCIPASAATKISKTKSTLIVGQTLQLKVTGTKSKVKWSSSKKSVATVTSKGKVTAKKSGSATITAKVGKKKYSCKIKVENPSLSQKSASINVGKTVTIKLNGTSQKVKWKTSKSSVATVQNGKITGKAAGTATITATVLNKNYSVKVTVKSKNIECATGKSATFLFEEKEKLRIDNLSVQYIGYFPYIYDGKTVTDKSYYCQHRYKVKISGQYENRYYANPKYDKMELLIDFATENNKHMYETGFFVGNIKLNSAGRFEYQQIVSLRNPIDKIYVSGYSASRYIQ